MFTIQLHSLHVFFALRDNLGNMHHHCSNRIGEWNTKTGGTHKIRRNAITMVLSRSSCNCSDGKRMCVALWVRVFALLFFDGKHWDMGERNMENQNCVCFCNITAQCAILHIKDQVCNWQQIKEHWEVQGVLVRNVFGRNWWDIKQSYVWYEHFYTQKQLL